MQLCKIPAMHAHTKIVEYHESANGEDKRTTEPLTLSKWAKLKKKNQLLILASRAMVPNLFGTRSGFMEDNSSRKGVAEGVISRMLQAHYIYSALYS